MFSFSLSSQMAEYAALRCLAAPMRALPYRPALVIGAFSAWIAFHVFRFRVQEAKRRIRQVFGEDMPKSEVDRIAWTSWRNIVFNGVETIRLSRLTPDWVRSFCDCEHVVEALKRRSDTGSGAVVACAHTGSWEMAGVVCRLHGLPIFTIAARQKNQWVNEYMNRLRRGPGMDVITRGDGVMKQVIRRLKAGDILAILPDVRVSAKGIRVPFLGGVANIGEGMALFARHCDAPVFPCILTRLGWCRHKFEIHDPIWPDKSLDKRDDVIRMTSAVLGIIDEAIRRDPAQWFWFNKRWVLDP